SSASPTSSARQVPRPSSPRSPSGWPAGSTRARRARPRHGLRRPSAPSRPIAPLPPRRTDRVDTMPADASDRRLVRALVLADGDAPDRAGLDAAWPGWDRGIDLVVGADAGALVAERLGLSLDLVVGDGDSAGEAELARLAAAGVAID